MKLLGMLLGGFAIIWIATLNPDIPEQGKPYLQLGGLLMMLGVAANSIIRGVCHRPKSRR